jgi:tetratricopeptide (TPR) repeat protein
MSAFEDVLRNVCKVVAPDGTLRGTAFFVLPDGHALTCHHVVFGLPEIKVQLPDESMPRPAEYDAEHSSPETDVAVLRVSGAPRPGLQLARGRAAQLVYGYGFRPGSIAAEPEGHTFPGRLSPGQALRLRPSPEVRADLDAIGDLARKPWNQLPDEYRTGTVFNLDLVQGVQQGVSGGPVYDPELRRVTGMFRAVEGDRLAYVLSLDSVFDRWPELESDNERQVRDSALDGLWLRFGVKPVAAGASPVATMVEDHLEAVFRDYTLFGGRERELKALVDFARSEENGYFFMTGPPLGFGKTALMVALARALSQAPVLAPVVHFLNRKYQRWLDLYSCLENLCRQLMRGHALGGPLPNTENGLRGLYKALLQLTPAPEKCVVVILDGLDETIGAWNVDADMFPPDLPARVKVVFSAQRVADRDWLDFLGLRLPAHRILTIERLEASDVSDILARAGIATPDPTAASDRLFKLSSGDAFYLVELLQDLREAAGDLGRLSDSPFSEYLRTWWDQAGEDAFYDLMGTLSVAVAPLSADALVAISPHDALKGKNIGRVLKNAARYISGSHDEGYQLKHARIRRFVANTMTDEIRDYQDALAEFCIRWRDRGSSDPAIRYVVEYGVRQLIELKRFDHANDLLSADFLAAQWRHLGSFRGHIKDLSLITSAMYFDEHANAPRVLGLLVARQTVRDAISDIPPELFAAWLRLGDGEWAMTMAGELTEARGAASAHLVAMAEELLSVRHAFRTRNAHRDVDNAASLLRRALGLIPAIRMPFMRYERFEQLVRIVASLPGHTQERKAQLAQQAIKWGEAIVDPIERSFVLGLAAYLSAVAGDRLAAENALALAEQAGARIALASDRLMVFAYRMLAIQQLFPDELEARFPGFEAVTDREATFPLSHGNTCGVVAGKLADLGPAGGHLLRKLAAQVAGDIEDRAVDAREVANALLRLGAVDEAVALIDTAQDRSAKALDVLLDGIQHLELLQSQSGRAWWAEAHRRAAPHVLAAAGDWIAALDRLQRLDRRGLRPALSAVLRVIDTGPHLDDVPPAVWGALTSLTRQVPDDERAECLGLIGLAVSGNPEEARRFLDEALRLVVARSAAGGTEPLQSLYAVALHQDGLHAQAAQAAARIDALDVASKSLADLIEYSGSDMAAIALYMQALLDCVTRADDPQIFESVAAVALNVVRTHPDAGRALYKTISDRANTVGLVAVDLAVTGCWFDPDTGWERCMGLVELIAKMPSYEAVELLNALLTGLARISAVPAAKSAALVQLADRSMQEIRIPDSRRVRLQTAKASLVARYAPDEAIGLLRNVLEVLAKPRLKSPGELAAIHVIIGSGLYSRGPAGLKLDEAADAVRVWSAALVAIDDRPEDVSNILGGVLTAVGKLASPPDETTALSEILATAGDLWSARRTALGSRLDQAIEQAASIARPDYQVLALQSAVRAFLAAGDIARAERAASLIRATEPFDKMDSIVATASQRMNPLTPVERHLTRLRPKDNLAHFSAYYSPSESDRWPFMNSIIGDLLQESESTAFAKRLSREVLLNFVLSCACFLYRIGGANMISPIIDTIEASDARLREAGVIISKPPMRAAAVV